MMNNQELEVRAHRFEGDQARDRRDWAEAARAYRKVVELDPAQSPIWVQLGHALKEQGLHAEAEAAYLEASRITPEVSDTFIQLGHLYKIWGRRANSEASYARALRVDPDSADAHRELRAYGWSPHRIRQVRPVVKTKENEKEKPRRLVIELTDLVDYLARSKFPTGIQRVQLALAQAYLDSSSHAEAVSFVVFDWTSDLWIPLDKAVVRDLIALVDEAAYMSTEAHAVAGSRLRDSILGGIEFEFPRNSVLVNPGTSWGHINYFLALREARRKFGFISYVPFVHDCIPLLFPEYCHPNLVTDFINWLTGLLEHADLVLTNSENTKADLIAAAAQLSRPAPPCKTVYLNGSFRREDEADTDEDATLLLKPFNLDFSQFVLFVSTIEPRKNHALALATWSKLIKSGRKDVPYLVCVGGKGWDNQAFHDAVKRDEALAKRVLVLTDASEQLLRALYRRCLFTIYPSMYEGWGLPVSEAISFGKVPLVARNSSLPEAGGDLAVYFDSDSEADFRENVLRLATDVEFRTERETRIANKPNVRSWEEIAVDLAGAVATLANQSPSAPHAIENGRYYTFAQNSAKRLLDVQYSGEMFRAGNWLSPERWGCWTRPGGSELEFHVPPALGSDVLIYLVLRGTPNIELEVSVTLPPTSWSSKFSVEKDDRKLVKIPVHLSDTSDRRITLRLSSGEGDDFSVKTYGEDPRLAGIGPERALRLRRVRHEQPARLRREFHVAGPRDSRPASFANADPLRRPTT